MKKASPSYITLEEDNIFVSKFLELETCKSRKNTTRIFDSFEKKAFELYLEIKIQTKSAFLHYQLQQILVVFFLRLASSSSRNLETKMLSSFFPSNNMKGLLFS